MRRPAAGRETTDDLHRAPAVIASSASSVDTQLKLAAVQRAEARDMLVRSIILIDTLTDRIDTLLGRRGMTDQSPPCG